MLILEETKKRIPKEMTVRPVLLAWRTNLEAPTRNRPKPKPNSGRHKIGTWTLGTFCSVAPNILAILVSLVRLQDGHVPTVRLLLSPLPGASKRGSNQRSASARKQPERPQKGADLT